MTLNFGQKLLIASSSDASWFLNGLNVMAFGFRLIFVRLVGLWYFFLKALQKFIPGYCLPFSSIDCNGRLETCVGGRVQSYLNEFANRFDIFQISCYIG